MSTSDKLETRCLIVGGGPAGMMASYLLARAGVSVAIIGYILYWGDELGDRATAPTLIDQVFGVALIVLILEGCRRSST